MRSAALDLDAIDRGFALEEYIARSSCLFDLIAVGPAPGTPARLAGWERTEVLPNSDSLRLTFSHGYCDALGALAAVRCLLGGQPINRTASPQPIRDRTAPPPRRALTRQSRPVARILPSDDRDGDLVTVLFDLRPSTHPGVTMTEACVIASHELALSHDPHDRACSCVLVPVSAYPWAEARPARNCSSGFLSTFTAGDTDVHERVLTEMELARGSRAALLKRIERYGRIPRFLWPGVRCLSRLGRGSGDVTAVISSLGQIDDPLLDAAASAWYIVPPTRRPGSLSIGLLGIGERIGAGVRGRGTAESVTAAAHELLERAALNPSMARVLVEREKLEMASATEWTLGRLRAVSGTRAEGVRDGVVRAAGKLMDLKYERSGEHGLHPLAKVTADHVGDPLEHWDVSDLPGFREHFGEMLAYLPHQVSSTVGDSVSTVGDAVVQLRTFTPVGPLRKARVVYLHGGGFVLGSERSNDPECDALAQGLRCQVVSVGYPLSPENPYPIPPTAVLAQLEKFVRDDDVPLVLCGESAGANLALAAWQASPALRARVKALVFAYPMFDLTLSSDSVQDYGSGYFLTRSLLEWFVECYAPDARLTDPAVSPLFGDNSLLPPTLALAAEFDPLRGDAERLAAVAPAAELSVYPGMLHGFLQLRGIARARAQALEEIVRFVSRSLG